MITKTLRKNFFREIRSSLSRFFAILIIIMIGSGFFVGLLATTPDMRQTADNYYENSKLLDFRLLSTIGFEEADISALRDMDSISGVMPGYNVDLLVNGREKETTMAFRSLPEISANSNSDYLNRLTVTEGRLPTAQNECVLGTYSPNDESAYQIGDILKVSGHNKPETLELVREQELEIVGFVESPLYVSHSLGNTAIGTGGISNFVYVPISTFDSEFYTEISLKLSGTVGLSVFLDAYQDELDLHQDEIDKTMNERVQARYDAIVQKFEDEKLDAMKELDDAKSEIDNETDSINTLDANRLQIPSFLESMPTNLTTGNTDGFSEKAASIIETMDSFSDLMGQTSEGGVYLTAISTNAKAAQADENYPTLLGVLSQLTQPVDENGATALLMMETVVTEVKKELSLADETYISKKEDALLKITDAEEEIKDLGTPKSYVLTRVANPGYSGFKSDSSRVEAIGSVIPIFFFFVAALVCLTTITRMVEEQRTQIGTLKALGFSKFSIAFKYIFYSGISSLFGAGLGIALGLVVFPMAIWNAYSMMYRMPSLELGGNIPLVVLTLALSIVSTIIPAIAASYRSLNAVPAKLMRPRPPRTGKRVLLEKIGFIWKRLKFSQKVTVRNLFRNKRRFVMTIVGVSGCTALLIAVFGLSDAINGMVPMQFGVLNQYDAVAQLSDPSSLTSDTKFNALVKDYGEGLYSSQTSVNISSPSLSAASALNGSITVPEDVNRLNDFVLLRTRTEHKSVEFPMQDKVIVTEKLAKLLKIKIGDEFTVETTETDGNDQSAMLTVGGIVENYVAHSIYMTPESYELHFSKPPEFNQVFMKFTSPKEDTDEAISTLLADEDVAGVADIAEATEQALEQMQSLNAIVWLVAYSAALLALIVIYNLTNINITERMREIATLKVLGFYDREVGNYIYRENVILTIIGILVGIVAGIFLAYFIVTTCEVDASMFVRKIRWVSYLYSILITGGAAVLVGIVLYRPLKRISMLDSLKSAE